MSITVSLINMKGGVGKTTLSMQIVYAAAIAGRRVLAVDIDPQANLSQSLMGGRRYLNEVVDQNRPTIVEIFEGYRPTKTGQPGPKIVRTDALTVKDITYLCRAGGCLHLIPSRLELARTLKNPQGTQGKLAEFLARVDGEYDLIVIDCPPTESGLTDAAYLASRYVLVPVKPEFLATIGLPLLARSIGDFKSQNRDHEIDICGIVFNYSSSNSTGPEVQQSIREVTGIAAKNGWPIFPKPIRHSRSYAKAAREGRPISRTSYARWNVASELDQFIRRFSESIGLVP